MLCAILITSENIFHLLHKAELPQNFSPVRNQHVLAVWREQLNPAGAKHFNELGILILKSDLGII